MEARQVPIGDQMISIVKIEDHLMHGTNLPMPSSVLHTLGCFPPAPYKNWSSYFKRGRLELKN